MGNRDQVNLQNVKVILLDIEGTTTSINFVKDVLFGYVRDHLQAYVSKNWLCDPLKDDVCLLIKQSEEDVKNGLDGAVAIDTQSSESVFQKSLIENVLWQMDNDRKTTGLKQLQFHIWREGVISGQIKTHLYDDVLPKMEKWSKSHKLFIYSSGSAQASKLLFENANASKFLSGYFDTNSGAKVEAESYRTIASEVGVSTNEILFLTDVAKESRAADEAGVHAVLVVRPGNHPLTDQDKKDFVTIESFNEVPS